MDIMTYNDYLDINERAYMMQCFLQDKLPIAGWW